ncbi:MAG: GTP-binding protein [Planctomycetota bacterium]
MIQEIFLVAGEFGAGKTTCVRRLARQAIACGSKPFITVFEYANDHFDLQCMQNDAESVVSLPAAEFCLDTNREIERVAEWCQNANANVLLIEVPRGMDVAALERRLRSSFQGAAAIYVISIIDAQAVHSKVTTDAVRVAPNACVVLVNKLDAIPEDAVSVMIRKAREAAPNARVIATVESTVTLGEIRDAHAKLTIAPRAAEAAQTTINETAAFLAVSFIYYSQFAPLPKAEVDLFLADPPPGTLRAKGCIQIAGSPHLYILQITGRSGALRRCFLEKPPSIGLLWITENPDPAAMRARLRGVMDT